MSNRCQLSLAFVHQNPVIKRFYNSPLMFTTIILFRFNITKLGRECSGSNPPHKVKLILTVWTFFDRMKLIIQKKPSKKRPVSIFFKGLLFFWSDPGFFVTIYIPNVPDNDKINISISRSELVVVPFIRSSASMRRLNILLNRAKLILRYNAIFFSTSHGIRSFNSSISVFVGVPEAILIL